MRRKFLHLAVLLVVIGIAVNLLCIAIYAASWSSFGRYTWKNVNGNWYLCDSLFGFIQTGWHEVDGQWYYLNDESGAMQTGWINYRDNWYYLGSTGMMQTGWSFVNGSWFHMDASGAMQTGWQFIDDNWYLLNEYGIMQSGWQFEDGSWYYLDSTGAMRTGWLIKDNACYYLNSDGSMLTGLQWIGKDLCYFENDGSLRSGKKPSGDSSIVVHINIPNYNQDLFGYPLGCEGVSLYMALKGLGYADGMSIHEFMDTMPSGSNPYLGYMGNPRVGRDGENEGKRTSIYPKPLSEWGSRFATVEDLTGASTERLEEELKAGHVVLIYATGGWKTPKWQVFPWSRNPKGEVTNNHCLSVVGLCDDGSFIVNDCGHMPAEYRVDARTFRAVYEARKFAVAVR